jgi:GntR family transcriptional regulator
MRMRPGVPFAIQVANRLRGRLRREYARGGQLPGENALAAEMGVSRGTVRQALTILQHEGFISRRQGLGTFANPHVEGIPARINFAFEFSELIEGAGYDADVKLLEWRPDTADAATAAKLEREPGAPLLRLRKLFLASRQPAIYVDGVLPTDLIRDDYDPAEFERPIFQFLDRRCQRRPKYILSALVPSLAEGEMVDALDVAPGNPILKFIDVVYDAKDEPLALMHIYFREPLIRFQALRKVPSIT